jgi:hypothetical protein
MFLTLYQLWLLPAVLFTRFGCSSLIPGIDYRDSAVFEVSDITGCNSSATGTADRSDHGVELLDWAAQLPPICYKLWKQTGGALIEGKHPARNSSANSFSIAEESFERRWPAGNTSTP